MASCIDSETLPLRYHMILALCSLEQLMAALSSYLDDF